MPTSSKALEVMLIGGPDEAPFEHPYTQQAITRVLGVLRDVDPQVRSRELQQKDALGGTWHIGEFVLTFLGGSATVAAVVRVLGDYVTARAGRKVRLKVGDIEAEASSVEELTSLLHLADERAAKGTEDDGDPKG